MDENALDHLNDPSVFAGKRHDCFGLRQSWKYLDVLHQRDPVFHLWDYPSVDDQMLVVHFDLNYFVDAMSCCWKTVCYLKDGQMKAFHLKKYLMLNVMADAPLRDDQMKDVMTLP